MPSTGYSGGLWNPEGSDYSLENGVLHKYTGTGGNWSWSSSGVNQAGIKAVKAAGVLELKIPRASLVGLGANIRIGVDIESPDWNNVGAIPATGSAQAPYAF